MKVDKFCKVEELEIVIYHIANLLSQFPEQVEKAKYGLVIDSVNLDYLNLLLSQIKLPDNIYIYELSGKRAFAIRGAGCRTLAESICYIVRR